MTMLAGSMLQESSVRLRWGAVVIVALLWSYGLLELDDHVRAQQEQAQATNREIGRLRAVVSETFWPEARETVASRIEDHRRRAWVEESEGAFKAVLQDWIIQAMAVRGLSLKGQTIRVDLPADEASKQPPLPENLRLVHVELVMGFDGPKVVDFLSFIYGDPHMFWVEKFSMNTQGERLVTIELATLFALGQRVGQK